ncbi:MAG: carbohydrate kinase family protein [Chloroflexota bacterium]
MGADANTNTATATGDGAHIGRAGCAGMIVADLFCGPLAALPPEGSLVTVERFPLACGGCAANVAIGLARQGVPVDLSACVGNDPAGAFLRGDLALQGVDVSLLRVIDGLPTSQTVILLLAGEDRRYVHVIGANAAYSVDPLGSPGGADGSWLATLETLYAGGLYAMPAMTPASVAALFAEARALGVRTVLDVVIPAGAPDPDPAEAAALLAVTDIVLPNGQEAARLTGETDSARQCRALRAMGAGAAVVTLGAEGVAADDGQAQWRAPAFPVTAIDPSGGGDAFAAGLIAALHRGASFREAVRWAQAAGASATMAVGTTSGVFTAAETDAFLRDHDHDQYDDHRHHATPGAAG